MNSHIYTGNSPVTSVPSWPNVIQVQQTLDAASDCDEDDEVCCQCNKWSPPGLKLQTSRLLSRVAPLNAVTGCI